MPPERMRQLLGHCWRYQPRGSRHYAETKQAPLRSRTASTATHTQASIAVFAINERMFRKHPFRLGGRGHLRGRGRGYDWSPLSLRSRLPPDVWRVANHEQLLCPQQSCRRLTIVLAVKSNLVPSSFC